MVPRQPSDDLRSARRALDAIPGYRLLADLSWHDKTFSWFLTCRLTIDTTDGLLPPSTDWCVVIEDRHPGDISIYPAVDGGIEQTFQHQLHNGPSASSYPWRTGKICTTTPESILGRLAQRQEPVDLGGRLVWHVQRALWWVQLASQGTLAADGAPYELPDFPQQGPLRFVFSEDQTSCPLLLPGKHKSGLASLHRVALSSGEALIVERFQTDSGKNLRSIAWGPAIRSAAKLSGDTAKWILIDSAPIAGPWQAPVSFGELRLAMGDQGLSLDDLILPLPRLLRDGRPHLLLVGFPIPEVIGGKPVQIHWQALVLPALELRAPPGFRQNTVGWKRADRRTIASDKPIGWLRSENWSPTNSHARGRFAPHVTEKRVLIIGAGALGSALAEVLVRGGIKHLTVCDRDVLEHGNLARHTLRIEDVGGLKANALAARLQSISAHAEVCALPAKFPWLTAEEKEMVSICDLVVDCTAEEETLLAIEGYPWAQNAYLTSMSFGWFVHRLYVVGAPRENFTRDAVIDLLHPLEKEDLANHPSREMIREGPGCWHPVFPGRSDDIWMMAAMGAKELERLLAQPSNGLRGTVFKYIREDEFQGVWRQAIV